MYINFLKLLPLSIFLNINLLFKLFFYLLWINSVVSNCVSHPFWTFQKPNLNTRWKRNKYNYINFFFQYNYWRFTTRSIGPHPYLDAKFFLFFLLQVSFSRLTTILFKMFSIDSYWSILCDQLISILCNYLFSLHCVNSFLFPMIIINTSHKIKFNQANQWVFTPLVVVYELVKSTIAECIIKLVLNLFITVYSNINKICALCRAYFMYFVDLYIKCKNCDNI